MSLCCGYIQHGLRLLICCMLLYFSRTGKAEMTSKCAVNGTVMDFYCSYASWWYVDYQPFNTAVDNFTVEASIDPESITTGGFNIIDITCFSHHFDDYFSADLMIIVGEQIPLNVTATPVSKTLLLLEWGDPAIPLNFTYTVTITLEQEQQTKYLTQPSLLLNLEGRQCEPFTVTISMPGNCEDIAVTGSLFVEPPYPSVQDMTTFVMDNKTVILTWKQPDNMFEEANFIYNITARSLKTGQILDQRSATLEVLQSPWEVFHFAEVEFCEKVHFTLKQAGDCREQNTTTSIPIFPGEFVSELEVDVFFRESGDVGLVELTFQPPELCDYQMDRASYVISITDGTSSWWMGPDSLLSTVVVSVREQFIRDKQYTATATIITDHGNVTSKHNFSTASPLGDEILDEESLIFEIDDDSNIDIEWSNPTHTLSDTFAYVVNATLVGTGEIVAVESVVVAKNHVPSVVLPLSQYICKQVNITVGIFNSVASISKVVTPPSRSNTFQQDTTAYTFMIDGKIKELEVSFTPPKLCNFQSSSYVMSFTSSNETWSRGEVVISDTSKHIKVDIESGFGLNTNYTVAVTVIMEHGNITSSAHFSFVYDTESTITSDIMQGNDNKNILHSNAGILPVVEVAAVVGVAVVLVLVGTTAATVIGVFYLKRKKTRADTQNKIRPTVTNPIYESGEDVYEELPDANYEKVTGGGTYSDMAPPLPSMRYDHLPAMAALKDGTLQEQDPNKVTMPVSTSAGALSALSGEDCYQVMSPAGTLTMMPRNRNSGIANGGPQ